MRSKAVSLTINLLTIISLFFYSQGSFCYDGKPFGLVEEDTIVQIGGNHVVLWNLSQGTKDYLP